MSQSVWVAVALYVKLDTSGSATRDITNPVTHTGNQEGIDFRGEVIF